MNDADILTRIPQKWFPINRLEVTDNVVSALLKSDIEKFKEIHDGTHMGLQRSIYLAKEFNINVSEKDIQQIILQCNHCQSIDPAPVRWEKGNLDVDEIWKRIAIDVSKFEESKYLTIIYCGPSRFAIWRNISDEGASEIIKNLRNIFYKRGVVGGQLFVFPF